MIKTTALAALTAVLSGGLVGSIAPQDPSAGPRSPEEEQLVRELARQGVDLDPARGICALDAEVQVHDDLLEYLLVGPAGASHESAFATEVLPSVLNVALLALGVEAGRNASWSAKETLPTEEEMRAGISAYDIEPPEGDGFYLYVGWRSGQEVYFFRMEDVVRNLATGRSMERHRWVYLGSRLVPDDKGGEVFAADIYQNLVNLVFFSDGYTLVTGSLPACLEQTIWMINAWLVPDRGTRVRLFFSRELMSGLPPAMAARLPDIGSPGVEGR